MRCSLALQVSGSLFDGRLFIEPIAYRLPYPLPKLGYLPRSIYSPLRMSDKSEVLRIDYGRGLYCFLYYLMFSSTLSSKADLSLVAYHYNGFGTFTFKRGVQLNCSVISFILL
jgi:hypothetical protein